MTDSRLNDLVNFVLWLRSRPDPKVQAQQCEPFDLMTASKERLMRQAEVYWDHAHGED